MPSRVSYASSRLVPAPLVSISKQYLRSGDGEKIGSLFNITLSGVLVTDKGSPNSSGVFNTGSGYQADESIANDARLASILRKQEAVRELFSDDGLSLEIQSADGSPPIKCNPRVISINFSQDLWYNRCDYTIELEADVLYVNGEPTGEDDFNHYISSATESWSIESDEERAGTEIFSPTYRVSHSVSATGRAFYNEAGSLVRDSWEEARNWVTSKLGFDKTIALSSGVLNLPDYYNDFNHVRSQELDEENGSFSVTETWVLSSGNSVEDFEISIASNASDGNNSVSINGNVRGFAERDSDFQLTTNAIDNAEIKWSGIQPNLLSRAQTYSHLTLNITPLNTTISKNPINGVITYNYQYNDRPSNQITDSVSESISLNDVYGVDVFGVVPVLGRTAGPVLQDLGTKKEKVRNLNIELVFDKDVAGNGDVESRFIANHPMSRTPQSGELQTIIDSLKPTNTQLFVSNQSENWDGTSRYSYNVSWVYE